MKRLIRTWILLIPIIVFNKGYSQLIPTDSVKKDSITRPTSKKVQPRTVTIFPARFYAGDSLEKLVQVKLNEASQLDISERLAGFHQNLGQMGKPYRRYRYGLPTQLFQDSVMLNPVSGAEEAYILSAGNDIPYYDTKTPYINIHYGQGKAGLSFLKVIVSQNLSPTVNLTASYGRNKARGSYLQAGTDHYNIFSSFTARSKNGRYRFFANAVFNELTDSINGGVTQLSIDTAFSLESMPFYFNKRLQPVSLSGALLYRKSRALYVHHFYNLLGDSSSPRHHLKVLQSGEWSDFVNQYTDEVADLQSINEVPFPIYPTFDSTEIVREFTYVPALKITHGLFYRYNGVNLRLTNLLTHEWQRLSYRQYQDSIVQQKQTIRVKGTFSEAFSSWELKGNWELRQAWSKLFMAERTAILGGVIKRLINQKDSVPQRALSLLGQFHLGSVNPTFLQAYYKPGAENKLIVSPTLQNQNIRSVRLGVGFSDACQPESSVSRRFRLVEAKIEGFNSRLSRWIYYDTAMALKQQAGGEALEVFGADVGLHLQWRRIHLKGDVTLQQIFHRNASAFSPGIAYYLPGAIARGELFYENNTLSIAAIFRLGIDFYYQSAYYGRLFDPASQQYYVQNRLRIPGYGMLGVNFSVQIKRAYIFLRLTHATEDLFGPGYFTTPFYPMQDRMLFFGINWTFFD